MVTIAPSLLSADFADLQGQISLAEKGGADWLHLDVMDGRFVPNISFGPPVIRSLRKLTRLPFDTHLMIEDPDRYLAAFRDAGADGLTVHVETCRHLNRTIQKIKSLGARAGVCLNPASPVHLLADVIRDVDMVLIMSVNPGFGGQTFIPHSLHKLSQASKMIREANPGVKLEVDGGIDLETVRPAVEAGADVIVAGNAIFGTKDISSAIRELRARADSPAAP